MYIVFVNRKYLNPENFLDFFVYFTFSSILILVILVGLFSAIVTTVVIFSSTHMSTQQKLTPSVSSDFTTSVIREFISSLSLFMNAIKNGCPLLKYVGKFNGVSSP